MARIAFFCIPAYGHTNPTLEVIRELVHRGHEVLFFSYDLMKERIEETGAKFVSCDQYDIQMNLKPEDAAKIGKDIAFSMEVLVNTTLALDDAILEEMKKWKPDCIVADSMAVWGKLIALKLNIPLVSSTTTFAFNQHSAKVMKHGIVQLLTMIPSMIKANKSVNRLKDKGYPVKNALSVISNDDDTDTIVYTSPEFQPYSETFSDRYVFVGPSIRKTEKRIEKSGKYLIYISLGTVMNDNVMFYKNCINACKEMDLNVIISVGEKVDQSKLGDVPSNILIEPSVDQIAVLQHADGFITHCGMNSVNEALYDKVPLVLYPQTNEQEGVANRVHELGAGVYLKDTSSTGIRNAIQTILSDPLYKEKAGKIAESFYRCGGPKAAAEKIEQMIK